MAIDDSHTPASTLSSRRALLASALGAATALGAQAIGRPSSVRAADGDAVHVGGLYNGTTVTKINNTANTHTAFWGNSDDGIGIKGTSATNIGVFGTSGGNFGLAGSSGSSIGVWGSSGTSTGVSGNSNSGSGVVAYTATTSTSPAALAWGAGDGTGLFGLSDSTASSAPPAPPKTGVYGLATQDAAARGVVGETTNGHGVHGTATTGWAGYFAGKVYTTSFHEMQEISDPAAPPVNHGRLFIRNNGSNHSELCVRFASGAVQILATEP